MRITSTPTPPGIQPDDVDLTDPRFYVNGDPHAVWHTMRDRYPVHRHQLEDGRSYVSVVRHDHVRQVISNHRMFTSRRGNMLSVLGEHDPAADRMMVASDPPIHTALRSTLARLLSPNQLQHRTLAIRDMAGALLAQAAAGGPWDLAKAVAPFPMMFTGALMGLPAADWPELIRLTTTAIAPEDPGFGAGDRRVLALTHHELFEYFADQAMSSRHEDDLIGAVRHLRIGDRAIRPDEVIYNCYNLLLGAVVTVPQTIATTVKAFADHPDQFRRIGAGQADIDLVVAEGLRWSTSAIHTMRYTTTETEIDGHPLAAGEAVVAWLASANRDERVFPDPYAFDVTRTPNNHLAFGAGRHYCIGAPLAKIALGAFFSELLRVAEGVEVAGPVTHLVSNFIGGYTSLPLNIRWR